MPFGCPATWEFQRKLGRLQIVHYLHTVGTVLVGIGETNRDMESLLLHLCRRFNHMRRSCNVAIAVNYEAGSKRLTDTRLSVRGPELDDGRPNDVYCLW